MKVIRRHVPLAHLVAAVIMIGVAVRAGAQTETDPLQSARRLFDAYDYEGAITELDRVIPLLDDRRKQDPANRAVLAAAIELRARARFGADDIDGSRSDLMSLFQAFPGQLLPTAVSPKFATLFHDVKRIIVGELRVTVTPADAIFELDGRPWQLASEPIPLVAGAHSMVVQRAGYRSVTQKVAIEPGGRFDLPIALERIAAVLKVTTAPSGVEVFVNNSSRGITQPVNPASDQFSRSAPSAPLLITDVQLGTALLEFRGKCLLREERRVSVPTLADYDEPLVVLKPADGEISIESEPSGASVVLNGEAQGSAPMVLKSVCEGAHTIELRSIGGRYLKRVELRAGQREEIKGVVRPAFALLPARGSAEDRGQEEIRLRAERRLGEARLVTFFVPPPREIEEAMKDAHVPSGWLRVDRDGRFIEDPAEALTSRDRLTYGTALSRALGVQGIATVNQASDGSRNEVTVAILALGSGEPDVISLSLDPTPGTDLFGRLNAAPPLFTRNLGFLTIDVLDRKGAEVAEVTSGTEAAAAGLLPGDVITEVGDKTVDHVEAFERGLNDQSFGEPISVRVHRGSEQRRIALRLQRVPALISGADSTILFNTLLVQLRARAILTTDPDDQSLLNLHSAVALMRGRNWHEALAKLDRVNLPSGPGVSRGTVHFLTALCYEGLDQPAAAVAALQRAAAETDSLLTPDGPTIKELAEERLRGSRR